jgi:lipid A 3-O-deacylase
MPKVIFLPALVAGLFAAAVRADDATPFPKATPNPPPTASAASMDWSPSKGQIWANGPGEGLPRGTRELDLSLESGFGLDSLVGRHNHDLALASIRYGGTLGGVVGESHWYRGNWEVLGELFGGAQYQPRTAYVVGATPLLRYTFATGTKWSPFLEGGFGPSFTDIGRPDLGSTFEFNIQGDVGVHYFWNQHQALTLQCRYFHLSNGGLKSPNQGVNACVISIGTSWFF